VIRLPERNETEIGSIGWRTDLLELIHLLGRLTPDYSCPERFFEQRSALIFEFKKLAARMVPRSVRR
jgi:hypothetical protein